MELFNTNGHLTDEGLNALISETLDEMNRLEAAEHIGFCDECLNRYTAVLTGDVLIDPQTPLVQPVLRGVRAKKIHLGWARYATVAAAAVLAVLITGAGSMLAKNMPQNAFPLVPENTQAAPQPQEKRGFMSKLNDGLSDVGGRVNSLFGFNDDGTPKSMQNMAEPEELQQSKDPMAEDNIFAAPKDKEDLFDGRKPKLADEDSRQDDSAKTQKNGKDKSSANTNED